MTKGPSRGAALFPILETLMDFYKYHALGNDYIIIDPQKTYIQLTPERIALICHRNYGIGSDGILYGPHFDDHRISFQVFNPDGSEAEVSGNGLRIFSRYLVNSNYVIESEFTISTGSGDFDIEILKKDGSLVKVNMGAFTFQSGEIPVAGEPRETLSERIEVEGETYTATCLAIGNPHCVIALDEISPELAKKIGPPVERHPLFPNRVNVEIMKVVDRGRIDIEIWERGAGYTLASGSCACAAVSAAHRNGLVDNRVDVKMQGGILEITINEDGRVNLIGAVSSVAEGNFTYEMWKRITK